MAEQKTNKVTNVEILGSEYRLVGEDESYLKQLAQYVDNQLKEHANDGMVYSSGRLGILTCLNIADQFFKLKDEYRQSVLGTMDNVTNLIGKIDNVLGHIEQDGTASKTDLLELISARN